jgi:hypothetical protein
MQFETILPFLRPIEHLILDPDISEIMVNAVPGFLLRRTGRSKQSTESYSRSKLCVQR